MKKIVFTLSSILISAGFAGAAITTSSIAPALDGADQGNMTWTTTSWESFWNDRPNPGQSFTTGSDLGGYQLNSFSFQLESSRTKTGVTMNYDIRLVSISGTTSTTVASENGMTWNGIHSAGDWLTFTFTIPVSLSPNTLYGVDFEHISGGAWQDGTPAIRRNGNDFAGGARYTRVDGDPLAVANQANDSIFHVDIAVIPEPSVVGLAGLSGLLLLRRRR